MAFVQIDFKSEALMRAVNVKVILPSDAYMLLAETEAFSFLKVQFHRIFGDKEAYYGSACDMCTQCTRKDVDNRPELFLCCGNEDRAVYSAVEKLEIALQEEDILHIYCGGHGDHAGIPEIIADTDRHGITL